MSVTATTGDLTRLDVDVVVNAANEHLSHGGGVAAALVRAGGGVVQVESDAWVAEHGPVGFGQAAITGAGAMPAAHVAHVVGPRWSGSDRDRDRLAAAVMAALDAASDLGARSIAFPAISTGVFGGPLDECARIIAVTALAWTSARAATDPPDDTSAPQGDGAAAQGPADMRVVLVGFDDQVTRAFDAALDPDPGAWTGAGPVSRDRPRMPDGYGVPGGDDGMQDWSRAAGRLADADTAWFATTRPDGRPHVVPRWGVWIDDSWWYDGAPTTRHVRNLADNEAATLHLESGTDVVIVNGTSGPTDPPARWRAVRIAAAMQHKYAAQGYAPGPASWDGPDAGGLCRFVPTDALAWASFPTDVTRWRWA